MQLSYRAGVGELIWAMTTCRPDIAFASVKLSQSNSAPHNIHYHGLKHTIKYLYATRTDGIYYWRTSTRHDLNEGPFPPINSCKNDLVLENRPEHKPNIAVAYADSDWATCTKTKPVGHLLGYASSSQAASSHTKQNSNRQWPSRLQKPNSWRHAMLDGCAYLYAAYYGIWTYHRKQQQLRTKTIMDAQQ